MNRAALLRTFIAGFEMSREGKNGECFFVYRNNADDGVREFYPYQEYLEMKFNDFLSKQVW